jgi:uncharacterized protein (UPF0548 family)
MFCWSKPNRDSVIAFLSAQQNQAFSYDDVGSSRREAPKGYIVDHNRIKLGQGVQVFERAKCAVTKWKMFNMPWIDLCWPDTPVQFGANVAVVISHFGFWSMNACRIVYVIDEHGSSEKYGFAYGTLPEHGERGEERFTVELNADQTVGTTCMRSRGQAPLREWPILSQGCCRNVSPETRKRLCRRQFSTRQSSFR